MSARIVSTLVSAAAIAGAVAIFVVPRLEQRAAETGSSPVADINNIGEMPLGGAIIAGLFLKRFVKRARRFAHFDIFGWRMSANALGPKGGEPQGARGLFTLLKQECTS